LEEWVLPPEEQVLPYSENQVIWAPQVPPLEEWVLPLEEWVLPLEEQVLPYSEDQVIWAPQELVPLSRPSYPLRRYHYLNHRR
jgi:hypothetical protein